MTSDPAGSASGPNADSDLEDLIAKSPPRGKPKNSVAIDSGGFPSSGNGSGGASFLSPLSFISGSLRLFSYKFPRLSKCAFSIMALAFIAFLSNTVFNPSQKMGIMGADYSAITSAYDLSLSKVDHWCIQGDNNSCKCEDPLEPISRSDFKSWNAAHKANVADVDLYRAVYGSLPTLLEESTGKSRPPIDVAFLGESVVEAMDGRWLGKRVARAVNAKDGHEGPEAKNPDIGKVFERLFRKEKGGPVEGVALGIAGDNTANVLWRLQHDEMPYDFNPQVWWLVLGMNDLTRMQCSEEIVVLGILRVVEEIRLRKPDAKIVINSLLPMINYQSREQLKMSDFADFKQDKDDKMRENMEIDQAKKKFKEQLPPPNKNDGRAAKPTGLKNRGNGERKLRGKEAKMGKKQREKLEDKAREGPNLKAALERRKKILERKDKPNRDKKFADNEKYHPKRPVSKFLPMIKKRVLPPVWPSVHLINDKLREFCTKHDDITFFDATPIFASDQGGGKHQLRNDLISPRGHPSELGFAVWEGHIMGRLHKWIVEKPAPPPKEDPDAKVLSPVREVSGDEGEDGESGDGSDHVSDGKEAQPEEVDQPSRDDPPPEEEKVKGKGEKSRKKEDDFVEEEEHGKVKEKKMRKKEVDVEEEEEEEVKGEKTRNKEDDFVEEEEHGKDKGTKMRKKEVDVEEEEENVKDKGKTMRKKEVDVEEEEDNDEEQKEDDEGEEDDGAEEEE